MLQLYDSCKEKYVPSVASTALTNKHSGALVTITIISMLVFQQFSWASDSFLTMAQISTQAPKLVGWGGTRLSEIVTWNETNPASEVFPREQASNQEVQVRRMVERGYNVFRVSFAPACSSLGSFMSPYNSARLERSIKLAGHFGLWIIVDYHGYNDTVTETSTACWLGFWKEAVSQFENRYERIIWEPLNEPTGFGGNNVTYLSTVYQMWIDQARALGDRHWIIVQNLCSFGCSFSLEHYAQGYPSVGDPLRRIFISLHSYMYYPEYSSSWNNNTAEAVAQGYYWAVLNGSSATGWPVLNTEGGMDSHSGGLAPDQVLPGSAGYTVTTFHFLQTLINLYDSYQPRTINWVLWPVGSWTDTPGANVYGALADNGWGSLLTFRKATVSVTPMSSTIGIG